MPDLYIFDSPVSDRGRLLLQAELFRDYFLENAPQLVGNPPARILDIGCGDGHSTKLLHDAYPEALIVGIDRSPQAIAVAREQPIPAASVTFLTGDIQEALPAGPFDLAYASFVLLHTTEPARVVKHVAAALAPGGTFWVKDQHPGVVSAGTHSDYQYLMQHAINALSRIGAHPYIGTELPALLTAAGFSNITQHDESYPLGGDTIEGEIALSNAIAIFRNTAQMVSQVEGIPIGEIQPRCTRLLGDAQARVQTFGRSLVLNTLARRATT